MFKILLVDDEPIIKIGVQNYLKVLIILLNRQQWFRGIAVLGNKCVDISS